MSVVSFNPSNQLSLTPTASQVNSVNNINSTAGNAPATPGYDFNTFKPSQPIVNSPATPGITAPQNGNYNGFWNSSGTTINPSSGPNMANLMPTYSQLNGGASSTSSTAPGVVSANTNNNGNWTDFKPTYLNNGYNPSQYASNETTNDLAGRLGGSSMRTDTSMNPGGAFAVPSQNMIDLGGEDGLNAGLLAQRYASMPKAQADALTQAELATMGRRTTSNDQAQANATTAGGTPTYAGRGPTSPASPLAQQAFASANGMPKGLAYQAGYNANGQLMPSASQFGQQQSQYAQDQNSNQQNSQQSQMYQQIQQLMPILQLLGGFGSGGQGINLSQLFSGMHQRQQQPQRTPYGYTQWNSPAATGNNGNGLRIGYGELNDNRSYGNADAMNGLANSMGPTYIQNYATPYGDNNLANAGYNMYRDRMNSPYSQAAGRMVW